MNQLVNGERASFEPFCGLEVRCSKILWVRTIYLDGKLVAPYPKWDGYFLILDSY